jgi:hypothetical protein
MNSERHEYIFDEAEKARILREASRNGLPGRVKLARGIEDGIAPPEEFEPGVLLKGRVHSIFAAGGIGKTWLVLWLVKRALERGEKVLLLDAENGHRIISERLAALGVDTARLDELLHYYPFPDLTLDPNHVAAFEALLDAENYDLIVFDSLVNFLGSAGLEENSNDDIVKWATRYTRPAREREITTVVLDHVPHDGKHARGASRKRDEVDVMWELSNPIPFDRDTVGRIVLRREKDREGWLGERVGFSVGGTLDGFLFRHSEGTIEEPDEADGLTPSARKALDVLRDEFGASGAEPPAWHKAVGTRMSKATFYRAKTLLTEKGLVVQDGTRCVPTPDGDGGNRETRESRTDKLETALSHVVSSESHETNETEVSRCLIGLTTLKGETDETEPETPEAPADFASSLHRQNGQQGSKDKGGSEVDTGPDNLSSPDGGSAPGSRHGGNDVVGRTRDEGVDPSGGPRKRRLTTEEAERVKRLVGQGMGHSFARAEVLGDDDRMGL